MSSNNSSFNCEQTPKEDESKQESEYSLYKSASTNQPSESAYGSLNQSNSDQRFHTGVSKGSGSSHGKCSSIFEETNNHKRKEKSHKKSKHKTKDESGSNKAIPETPSHADSGMLESENECDVSSQYQKENKAIKVAQLSQCLDIIDRLKKFHSDKDLKFKMGNSAEYLIEKDDDPPNAQSSMADPKAKKKTIGQEEASLENEKDGFCIAISLQNGMVMHITPSITSLLGYPKDMWLGRSFMDFVYPKDRLTFTQQITNGVSNPIRQQISATDMARKKSGKTSFFCRLRMYNGLQSGKFSIRERGTIYIPFKLIICFKEMDGNNCIENEDLCASSANKSDKYIINPQFVCLLATCIPLKTPYSCPNDLGPFKQEFITKHNSNCKFIQVSDSGIPFIGYMPQDIENQDIFNFYHPQDLPYLKTVYESVVKDSVKIVQSRPYRFKASNGGYITIKTDWSCFINPWFKKLEFVIGKHKIIEGPSFPDIFASSTLNSIPCNDKQSSVDISENIVCIRNLLKETFVTDKKSSEPSTRRRKELASFMGTLLEEMAKVEQAEHPLNDRLSSKENSTAILGCMRQPRDKFICPLPLSYSQLNYNENLYRFFNSQPPTISQNEAAAMNTDAPFFEQKISADKIIEKRSNMDDSNSVNQRAVKRHYLKGKNKFKINGNTESGDSGELGASVLKENKNESVSGCSGSNSNSFSGSRSTASEHRNNEQAPLLTMELLYEHNKRMERKLLTEFKNKKEVSVPVKKNSMTPKKYIKDKEHPHLFPIQTLPTLNENRLTGKEYPPYECVPSTSDGSEHFVQIAPKISNFPSAPSVSFEHTKLDANGVANREKKDVSYLHFATAQLSDLDVLLNSVSVKSILDGIDHKYQQKDTQPRFKSPTDLKVLGPESRDTSVKGEPGSVLESFNVNTTPSMSANLVENVKKISSEYGSSNSSSWFSFLRSSDEALPPQGYSSGSIKNDEENNWNGTNYFNYQMEERDLETVLREDRIKLSQMTQPYEVEKQFREVYLDMQKNNLPLFDDISSNSTSTQTSDDTKDPKEFDLAKYLRNSIFYDELCPLPPPLKNKDPVKERSPTPGPSGIKKNNSD